MRARTKTGAKKTIPENTDFSFSSWAAAQHGGEVNKRGCMWGGGGGRGAGCPDGLDQQINNGEAYRVHLLHVKSGTG